MLGLKPIVFNFPAKMHAELKARLLYDEMSMAKFIRSYVQAYLENDFLILEFINQCKEKNNIQNKQKRQKNIKLIEKGKEIENVFNLTGEEVNELYDILEEEMGAIEI